MKKLPRGLRNNNPLNIVRTKDKWRGMSNPQWDHRFVTFTSVEYGYRAAYITLRNYQRKHNRHTLEEIITRWAPWNENNTEAYIRAVENRAGIDRKKRVNLNDIAESVRLMEAMSFVENGVAGNIADITKGVNMVL